MYSTIVHLHEGEGDSWAINLAGDIAAMHRAQQGVGANFHKVWSLELRSAEEPNKSMIDWDAVLERVIYAYDMNDPLIDKFEWPLIDVVKEKCS